MAEVFISYARTDEAAARRVAAALEATGATIWWDADLPAHRDYSEVIETRLAEAEAVVVLWSAAAAKSQWVRAEADYARTAGKLVQASLDGGLPPMPFNQIQCAGLKGWRGSRDHSGWAKLEASVQALLSGEERPARAAERQRHWWQAPRARWAAAAGALLILLAIFLVPKFIGGSDDKPVVAVLPFESLDRRDESLVAGIWEDTRQAIGRNPQLLVLGPNTSEEIAEKGGSTARKLADFLVEASVRSVGDRIRVSANLVRTKDGAELWNKNFDRRLGDVFALQSEIAGEIEGHIRGRLAERGGIRPENIATSGEVYALYSDARIKIRKRQIGRYEEAAKQLQQVVARDPNFAPGWATLAVIKKFGLLGGEIDLRSAEADARRAIALAPNLAAGHAALGFVLDNGPAAQAALRRALELEPNDIEALHWLANSLDPKTQKDERLRLYSKVVEIEPLWWPAILNKLNMLFELENLAAIEAELQRLRDIGNETMAAAVEMQLLERKGDLSGVASIGVARYRSASEDERELIAMTLFPVLHQLGYHAEADRIFRPPNAYIDYIRSNDPRALDLIEAQHSPQAFWTFGALGILGARVYLLNNQGPRLARLYRAVASTPEQFESIVGPDRFPDIAPGAALALRSAGDEAQARLLLELAEERASKLRARPLDKLIRLARIHAVQGRTDDAIGELSAAVRGGWIPPFLPIHTDIALDPPLNELRGDPRFGRLRQQILDYLKKERIELGPVSLG